MDDKLTSMAQLRQTAMEAKGLIGQVASTVAGALEELENKKQDTATALTEEKVNEMIQAAIKAAILDSWEASY